jgi:3-hydroxymyristoyl/3-hydroxydecanoyl-(acyl carrier protein) dehydratase
MKLPTILITNTSKKDEVMLDLEISSKIEAFHGHFPGNPILPGVVQIDWAMRFASIYLGVEKPAMHDFQVKFYNIIRPDVPISLTLKFDRPRNRLSFLYQSGDILMSSGQSRLGAKK